MFYYLFTIEYDGTDFCGWAKQKGQKTIQGEIERAINLVTRNSHYRVVGASKTDSGVHAKDQKAWIELDFKPNILGFLNALNRALPLGIKIRKANQIEKTFRVRNCIKKVYHYQISLKPKSVFSNRYWFFSNQDYDLRKLEQALNLFIGEHNFKNFSGLKGKELDTINTIRKIDLIFLKQENDDIIIVFEAKGFIRYQIRSIVGVCLAYSCGKITLENIKNVLDLKEEKLPYMANPEGLILYEINYEFDS
ncbi:tRNA pseudouridine(38-40) synthase TruA [Spiroplasma tabanidicola]|uniref:tRNA pseudouridine synthase A n=1 Tax=Spiroplasma tabanidicola TaxID=324079 RepID=A0A6I6CDY9_9MOLU|nr:tRNA pseudouridine(38-40) synthase TruA [Spiroplasma tabanidicola]QGS52342.1 tRNA pseudouridine synthase A [Spiroplasma tabanidicola]